MKKLAVAILIVVVSLVLLAVLATSQYAAGAAPATGDAKYGVCHVTADHTYPFAHYNYLEVGNLNGHFYDGDPDRPKHGAWKMEGFHFIWIADFVTELGDTDCDGVTNYTPTPSATPTVPSATPTDIPTDTPTATEVPTDTPTATDVPTEEPTPTNTEQPTDEPNATPTSGRPQGRFGVDCIGVFVVPPFVTEFREEPLVYVHTWTKPYKQETWQGYTEPKRCVRECKGEEVGRWFVLTGPDGQVRELASFQINPNTGRWSIPSKEAQKTCLGWVSMNAQGGRKIYKNCDGTYNSYCYRCTGGGPTDVYKER